MEHPMNIKERIGKLAEEVVAFYKDTNIPLTNAVAKIAKDYGLNNGEIEELCAKANHNVFREKYAGDKLAVFNIAQHKDAKDIIANKTKVAQTISAAPDIVIVEKIAEAVPLEDDQQEQWEEDRKKRNIANTTEAGESNADILNMLTVKRDDIVVGLYNTIKALYQSGSNLNEIYSVLSNTWGDQNKQETAKAFKSMVDKLKEEGYIEPNANYGEGEQPDMSDMEVVDSDIKTVAQKLAEVNNDIALHLIVHENIKSMLKTAGADIAAGDISKRILCGDYNNSSPLHKVAISKEISKVLGQALAATVIMSGIAGASTAGKSLIVAIKAPRVKKLILEKYPELREVRAELFDDLFTTFIQLNPQLLDTPFALASLILKHAEYGVIDTPTIKTLASFRPPNPMDTLESQLISMTPGLLMNANKNDNSNKDSGATAVKNPASAYKYDR